MSTIHEALNSSECNFLGPVTVKKHWGAKTTSKGKKMQSMQISDPSGESRLTLFEPASFANCNEGDTISLKGKVEVNEYNGNKQLQTSFAKIEGGSESAGPAPTAQAAPAPAVAAQPAPEALSKEDLAKHQAAHFARVLKLIADPVVEFGGDPSAAVTAAAMMTGSASDWWFGAKYPGM